MSRFLVLIILLFHTFTSNADEAICDIGGIHNSYQVAALTEHVVEEMTQGVIHFLAGTAEQIFPGSGKQTVYETADIINITLSYTQAGRALSRIRYGKLDSALKGALSTGRWLPQRLTTPWDRLVPTPLHIWTDAFFPQLQPQLALASGGLGSGHFSGLMPQSTRGTTFKMDGKGFGGDRGTHKPSVGKADIAPGTTPQLSTVGKVDTAPKPTPQIKKITNDSPKNVVNSVKLKAELAFREAEILDKHGKLTPKAIRDAEDLFQKEKRDSKIIKNPYIVRSLTKDGSKIEDWSKFTTQPILVSGKRNPYGKRRRIVMTKS